MREDGFVCDKLVLTTNAAYTPSGNGPPESARVLLSSIPTVTNETGFAVSTNSAVLNGTLMAAGWVFDVYAFWGTNDGGSVAADWDASSFAGRFTNYEGAVSCMATGLVSDVGYYYTFMASNLLTNVWASPAEPFTAQGTLVVSNTPPTNVTTVSATIGGELVGGGGGSAVIYWGLTDGEDVADDWANTNHLGAVVSDVAFATSVAVKAGGTYYYRCYATNAVSDDWAGSSAMFATPPSSLTIDDVLLTEGDAGTVDALFTVTLAEESATNVSVSFATADGRATAGADYTATNGTLIIPGGQMSGQIAVKVMGDTAFEYPSEDFVVNLSNSVNCTIADTQAVCTIIDDGDAEGYLGGFDYRMRITFDGYAGSNTLTNWPALVRLGPGIPGFDHSTFASTTGGDLRFGNPDSSDVLHYDIEEWSTDGESCVWVRVPELAPTGTAIWAVWGNADETNAPWYAADGSAWPDDYAGVWHLAETGTVTRGDATGNGNDGIPVNYDGDEAVVGQIAGADDFDYLSSDALCMGNAGMSVSAGTVSMWVNLDSYVGADYRYFFSHRHGATDSRVYLYVKGGNFRVRVANLNEQDTGYTIPLDSWHYYALTWGGGSYTTYVDGAFQNSGPVGDLTGVDANCYLASFLAIQQYGDVTIDETRLSSVARSADWIQASYSNQVAGSTFNRYGDICGGRGMLVIVR